MRVNLFLTFLNVVCVITAATVVLHTRLPHVEAESPRIVAKALSLTDDKGTPRLQLGIAENGEASIAYMDEQGSPFLILSSSAEAQGGLVIKDAKGNKRLAFACNPSEATALTIFSKEGIPMGFLEFGGDNSTLLHAKTKQNGPSVAFSIDTKGIGVRLRAADGSSRASWNITEEGQPRFLLSDSKDQPRLILGLGAEGKPVLGLRDSKGTVRSSLTLDEDGSPALSLYDAEGKGRIGLAVEGDGVASIQFADKEGTTRAALGTSPEGAPSASFRDEKGVKRLALAALPEGTFLSLYYADGAPAASLGYEPETLPGLTLFDLTGKIALAAFGLNPQQIPVIAFRNRLNTVTWAVGGDPMDAVSAPVSVKKNFGAPKEPKN